MHITYDRNGVPVESHVDNETSKGMFPQLQISKPGPSIHTAEWDRCVEDIKRKNPDANAYAVCTAQLGEASFKSQYRHLSYIKSFIEKARKAVVTSFAGPVPNSGLADQDLEGEKKKSDAADDAKLYELKDQARRVDNEREKDDVADKIEEVQRKRQKAALKERGVIKSFKEAWKSLHD